MKIRTSLVLLLCISVMFVSSGCSGLLGVDLTKQEDVDLIKGKLEPEIAADASIVSISIFGLSDFSNIMDNASVTYYASGDSEVKTKQVALSTNGSTRVFSLATNFEQLTAEDGVKLSDIDFSKIAANVDKAVKFLKEEDLPFSGIGMYKIIMNKNAEDIIHVFDLESKADTETVMKHGQLATQTNYYSIGFVADANGEVNFKD